MLTHCKIKTVAPFFITEFHVLQKNDGHAWDTVVDKVDVTLNSEQLINPINMKRRLDDQGLIMKGTGHVTNAGHLILIPFGSVT